MIPIDYEKIFNEIADELKSKESTAVNISFADIKLNKAQMNNYTLNYDDIDFGAGIKKIISKLMHKLIKRTLLFLTKDQNEINSTLAGKIEELSSKVQYLENKAQILEEKIAGVDR